MSAANSLELRAKTITLEQVYLPIGIEHAVGRVIVGSGTVSVFAENDLTKRNGWRVDFSASSNGTDWTIEQRWDRWLHKPGAPTSDEPTIVQHEGNLKIVFLGKTYPSLRWVGVLSMGAQEA